MFRSRAFGLTLALAAMVVTVSARSQTWPPQKKLFCRLTVETPNWHTDQPAVVGIELENASDQAVEVSVVPIFYLVPKFAAWQYPMNSGGYWAPTNIVTNHPLETDTAKIGKSEVTGLRPRELKLTTKPHSTTTYRVDMQSTLWDKQISSLWPRMPLSKTVMSGKHVLSLDIQDDLTQITCNKVEVQITKVQTQK